MRPGLFLCVFSCAGPPISGNIAAHSFRVRFFGHGFRTRSLGYLAFCPRTARLFISRRLSIMSTACRMSGRRRRPCCATPIARFHRLRGRQDVFPDRHRREWQPKVAAKRRRKMAETRPELADEVSRPALPGLLGIPAYLKRRLHPHNRAASCRSRHRRILPPVAGNRRYLPRQVRRLVFGQPMRRFCVDSEVRERSG